MRRQPEHWRDGAVDPSVAVSATRGGARSSWAAHVRRLLAEGVEIGLLPADQKLRSRVAYPIGEDRTVRLRNDREVVIRPSRSTHARLVQDLFFQLRDEDVQTRFFRRLRSLTGEMAQHLCSVGYTDEMAFAAVVGAREPEHIVGTASYFVDASTGMADIAYMVDPALRMTTAVASGTVEVGLFFE